MFFAKENDQGKLVITSRPDWRQENGEPVTDQQLIDRGFYYLVDEAPDHDPNTQYTIRLDTDHWVKDGNTVYAQYDVREFTAKELYNKVLNNLASHHEHAMKQISTQHPLSEREGWYELVGDVEAFNNGNTTGIECLESLSTELGITLQEAARRVTESRNNYRQKYAQATAKLTRLRDLAYQYWQSDNRAELAKITWNETTI